ncbi:hypothetical protein FIBSPDRAFT_461960 [Athelia psychrophila]|uniref:Uncharacterized protein n=1 Tax=Athelia psychrophila TaxID=1759441 RepID=A0A166LWP3_9AGAM|nr:hypothetical protein FIBSPDRAFT_461960 [Fibularhizoctonia sp. CBS 109695]
MPWHDMPSPALKGFHQSPSPVLPGSTFSFTHTKQSQKLYNLPLSASNPTTQSTSTTTRILTSPNPTTLLAMQFFKSTLFVAIAVAASFVAAAPAQSECIPLISKLACTQNSDCCSNECYLPDSLCV